MAPVSVVVPCYCCAGTIRRALASVAEQTMVPCEVILVEDASPDDGKTREMLNLVVAEYGHVFAIKTIFMNGNVGAASARNRGWDAASQPYIAFLDADDAWHPRKIEIQYAYMMIHRDVVLCGHLHRFLEDNDLLPDWDLPQPEEQAIHKWKMLLSNPFVTPSVMLRRDVAQRFIENQRHMEDHMLWLRIICSGGIVVRLTNELAAIYKRPFGMAGLSAQFWLMEKGDLGNYRRLYYEKCINVYQLSVLSIYSLLKYMRRLLIYWGNLRWKK
ncbi:MAG: glycosyltransferase family 2 protein [Gallionella sp.]|nr:glycosyltransferase family 2 protein [Gallionella sp.]